MSIKSLKVGYIIAKKKQKKKQKGISLADLYKLACSMCGLQCNRFTGAFVIQLKMKNQSLNLLPYLSFVMHKSDSAVTE